MPQRLDNDSSDKILNITTPLFFLFILIFNDLWSTVDNSFWDINIID